MLPHLWANLTCAWVHISPLHNAYPLRPEEFLSHAALWCCLGTLCGLLAAAGGNFLRGGKGWGLGGPLGSRGQVPRRLVERAVLILASLLSLGALASLFAPRSEAYDYDKPDGRPHVVIMMPLRKDLHPEITSKALNCLRAMEGANPELEVELFLFDKVVKRIPSDKRPLSKVARIRNMMIDMLGGDMHYDYVMWLDSDIIEYPPDLPTQLIRANPEGISAPLVLLEEPGPLGTDQFYDTTAFVQFHRSGVSDDPSPYVEGRNIGRLYPYVLTPKCEDKNLYDWRCAMPRCQDLDSVGTIYMVSADIFTVGRAVFADHSFTEHYPLMEHATRMGRQIAVVSSVVARHANLPYYGEIFHENTISGASGIPEAVKEANVTDVIGWIGTITSAYCDVLGRYPDEGGLIAYLSLLQVGSPKTILRAVLPPISSSHSSHPSDSFTSALLLCPSESALCCLLAENRHFFLLPFLSCPKTIENGCDVAASPGRGRQCQHCWQGHNFLQLARKRRSCSSYGTSAQRTGCCNPVARVGGSS